MRTEDKAEKLSELPNIGKELERLLGGVGIHTKEDLRTVGAIDACLRLNLQGEACYSKLYALEGAIRGTRWHQLPKAYRADLKARYDRRKISQPSARPD
jgi:DNA transformation protein